MSTQVDARSTSPRTNFRQWQRFRLTLPIRLIVSRDGITRILEGRAQDMSQGGLLIFAGVELKTGDGIFVEFTAPYSGEPLRAPGIVRHRRGYNYGIEFLGETHAERDQTERFRNVIRLAAGNTEQ
jgi:hypothetical protein